MVLAYSVPWHGACHEWDAIGSGSEVGQIGEDSTMAYWAGAVRAGAATAAVLLPLVLTEAAQGQARVALGEADPVEARVWLGRGEEPLLQRGDQLRVYYRATQDAYVAIFHIDTDGTARLAFPKSPDEGHYIRGGRDYRLLFPRSPYWYVEDQPGIGYYFIVASPERFDFSSFRFSHYDRGWDLSLVGRQVYQDPYMAMDDYVAALLPRWQDLPYALDFASYDVGERHEFPRFLCYNCHSFRSFAAWNPYYTVCTGFRVVVYDDPYFYPARRYRGDRVVWTRPPTEARARFGFEERLSGEPAGVVVVPRASPARPSDLRTRVPRRSPAGGAGGARGGGDARSAREPVNLGTIRGRATAPAVTLPGSRNPGGDRSARPRPTDPAPSGVLIPNGSSAAPTSQEPERTQVVPGPRASPRLRPVLRKRPTEGAGAAVPSRRGSGAARSVPSGSVRGSSSGSAGRAVPRAQPPRARTGAEGRGTAVRRPARGSTSGPSQGSRGGAAKAPVVRTRPGGRPVIRSP